MDCGRVRTAISKGLEWRMERGSAESGNDFDFNVSHCAGNQPGGGGVGFEVQQ
jgi:hypothetical protein